VSTTIFRSGETGVGRGPAHGERAGAVDGQVEVCGVERRGHHELDDVVPEVVMELLGPDLRIVLGGQPLGNTKTRVRAGAWLAHVAPAGG
jgi:hypothetical protein